MKNKIRQSIRTVGRKAMRKLGWHENCEVGVHAPAAFRRFLVGVARARENHHLRNVFANEQLDIYESVGMTKRNADWLYF
jgi:ribosomal protein L32E